MARMTHESAKEFENRSDFDAFTLVDDGDSAKVQFMIDDVNAVLTYTTHEIPMLSRAGREYQRKVGCLKQHKDDPMGVCPFCDEGKKIHVIRYIPMFDIEKKKIVLWERGAGFIDNNLASFFNRMKSQGSDIRNLVVEIVRQGKKGDTRTTYAFYPMDRLEPLDTSEYEIPDAEGNLILTLSASEMREYLSTGRLPASDTSDSASDAGVVRRRGASTSANNSSYAPNAAAVDTVGDFMNSSAVQSDNPEDFF